MDTNKQETLSPLKSWLFPIYKHEYKKYFPALYLFFCIAFNYVALRILKDSLVVKFLGDQIRPLLKYHPAYEGIGAGDMVSGIKLWGVMLFVVIFSFFYNLLRKGLTSEWHFTTIISYFLVFFIVYAYYIYPNITSWVKPENFKEFFPTWFPGWRIANLIIYTWPCTLLFIHAELYGTFALSVMFWSFMHEIINVKQSVRFYSSLALGANIGAVAAGLVIRYGFRDHNLVNVLWLVTAIMCTVLVTYNWFVRAVKRDPVGYQTEAKPQKKKAKLSLKQSLRILFSSKELCCIALLVLCYGVGVNLLEYMNRNAISRVSQMEHVSKEITINFYTFQFICVGLLSIALILFLSTPVLVKYGWLAAALITPLVLLLGVLVYFAYGYMYVFNQEGGGGFTRHLKTLATMGTMILPTIKACKYAFFDPTKEASYVPLAPTLKVQGKTAVDGVGGRLGKALGAITVVYITSANAGLFGLILGFAAIWIYAVYSLSKCRNVRSAAKTKPSS